MYMNECMYVCGVWHLWLEVSVRDVVVVQHLHAVDDLVEELAGLLLGHMLLRHDEVEHLAPT